MPTWWYVGLGILVGAIGMELLVRYAAPCS